MPNALGAKTTRSSRHGESAIFPTAKEHMSSRNSKQHTSSRNEAQLQKYQLMQARQTPLVNVKLFPGDQGKTRRVRMQGVSGAGKWEAHGEKEVKEGGRRGGR